MVPSNHGKRWKHPLTHIPPSHGPHAPRRMEKSRARARQEVCTHLTQSEEAPQTTQPDLSTEVDCVHAESRREAQRRRTHLGRRSRTVARQTECCAHVRVCKRAVVCARAGVSQSTQHTLCLHLYPSMSLFPRHKRTANKRARSRNASAMKVGAAPRRQTRIAGSAASCLRTAAAASVAHIGDEQQKDNTVQQKARVRQGKLR